MAKLTLKAAPTFKAHVDIPVPGRRAEKVEFTFRHRTREDLAAWLDALEDKSPADVVLEAASGWELEEPFDKDHVEELLSNYLGSFRSLLDTYLQELAGARAKN